MNFRSFDADKEKSGNIKYLCFVAAAAIYYGEKEENLNVSNIFIKEDILKKIMEYLELLKKKNTITDIIKIIERQ